eukprot:3051140-Amphidinium_carterae.1
MMLVVDNAFCSALVLGYDGDRITYPVSQLPPAWVELRLFQSVTLWPLRSLRFVTKQSRSFMRTRAVLFFGCEPPD